MSNNNQELTYLPISELRRLYSLRQLSPAEVVCAYLDRIERLDGKLHTYTTINGERAIEEAKESEQRILNGSAKSELDGIPIALKDAIDTAGLRTTANSRLYADRVPEVDAHIVAQLKESGVIVLGKNSMEEFGYSSPEFAGPFQTARNPWNLDHTPGGSCSGSAASVAAGLCAGAIGCDTGGSIRAPASYCSIVGLKPSAGLVSRSGVIPLSWSLDTVGPMTRTVEDAALLLQSIAGFDQEDISSVKADAPDYLARINRQINGWRIGIPLDFVETILEIHPDTLSVYFDAIEKFRELGAVIQVIDLPEIVLDIPEIWMTIVASEAFTCYKPDIQKNAEKFRKSFLDIIMPGALYTASDYIEALLGRTAVSSAMNGLLNDLDLLLLPTTSSPPLEFDLDAQRSLWRRTTVLRRMFNLSGQPAISIPGGFSGDHLPIGIQLAGRMFEEEKLFTAAHNFEKAAPWSQHHPSFK